jgi:putative ABC transport system permease protein
MVSNGQKSSVFMGSAVDPDAERSLGFTSEVSSGRDLDSRSGGEAEAIIGAGLAKSMNVGVGDGLTLLSVTSDGALNGVDVQVAGIVTTGVAEMDARYLRITLNSAQRLLQSDRITNLVVGLDSTANTDAIYATLVPRLGGLPQQMTLKKWVDLATYYKQVRTLFNGIFLFMGLIVFFMVLMSSVNTLLMTMFERTREIGAMLAMGTPRSWIVALFMTEAVIIGVLGRRSRRGQSVGRAHQCIRFTYAAAARLYRPHSIPCRARSQPHDRLFATGNRLAGIRIHSARGPRIAAANCGGIVPCLESTAFYEYSCCFS